MGFPDDFKFKGTKTDIARQIGNAVPPDFAGAVAGMVADFLNECAENEKAMSKASKAHAKKV